MSTMTFAFHDATLMHSLPPSPPNISAPTSLHNPAFRQHYDSWGLAPTTFSPAQYRPPAGFNGGLQLDMHLPDHMPRVCCLGATLLHLSSHSCSYPPYYGMTPTNPFLGNAFNPVAPTGLAPQAQTSSLPTLDFLCLAPPPSLRADQPLNLLRLNASRFNSFDFAHPSPPACSKRVQ